MINLFDLSAGASARVATRDGSPVRGTQSDRKEYADLKTVTGSMGRSSSDRSAGGTPMKSENALKRQQNHAVHGSRTEKSNLHRKPNAGHAKAERCPQHTRIVVLKPTSAITSAEQFQQNGHGNSDDSDTPVVSRHVSDEIHWSAHGMCHQHDECLQGSIQSNMVGRDRSYYDRAEEGRSSFSGSEHGSPTSCHSWDYIYRFSNPYFGSSLSHASCSPEAHVAREGKKHASDRWPRASSNEIIREKVPMRRSLSTLGEMLAMSDMKKEDVVDQVAPNASSQLCGNEPRVAVPSNCSVDGAEGENSNKKISRSKSVPVSSSAFDSLRLDARSSDSQHREATTPKEAAKPRNGKSSLKGKISSFFSMRRKAGKEKPITSPSGSLNGRVPVDSDVVVGVSRSACTGLQDDVASENLEDKYQYATIVLPVKESEALSSSKALISLEKAHSFEIQNSHFDEPSPTSVLDALFEDRNEKSASSSESAITAKQEPLSRCLPIGSVARTLSWDDSSSEEAAPCSSKEEDSHEQEQYEFVEKILSSAGLCSVTTSDVFARWHSLDSPLAPNVPDQFLERKVEDAKRRERRSGQRLLIDSVNAALLDIGQSTLWSAYPCAGPVANVSRRDEPVADAAWRLVKGWLSDDEASNNGLPGNVGVAADRVVGEEIEGRGWSEMLRLEVDDMTKQICGDVLGEVVEEALSEFPRVPLMDAP
uniref:Predicted protein n=1 Tax=Hordeum vulgare subsp. vulgare TaxID=112509 RepID=F2E2G3_HORVV|nr:predicted protein [Hordeum vulgare subsp. vulgare]